MIPFRKYSIIFLMICVINPSFMAQTDPCLSYLKDAQQKTDEGKYDDAILLAQKAIAECDFSKNDLIEAQKLLILNYLSIDDIEAAELSAARVMKINPNHEADRLRDPAEVIAIFNKYRPTPVFTACIQGGINRTSIDVIQTYSIVGEDNADGLDNYEAALGWQLGAGLEYRVWKNFWVIAEGQYRTSGFSHTLDSVQGQQVNYSERLGFIDINSGVRYYLGKRRLQPYAEGGFHMGFLISALGEISRNEELDIVNRSNQRNSLFTGYWLGTGISFQQRGLRFQLGARYTATSGNVVDPENRFDNLGIIFKYYYLDNDFSVNHIQFRASVVYVLRYRNLLDTRQ